MRAYQGGSLACASSRRCPRDTSRSCMLALAAVDRDAASAAATPRAAADGGEGHYVKNSKRRHPY